MAKAKVNMLNLGDAMLQGAREPLTTSSTPIMPTSEMPMILTLDEVAPNPDNPRTTRNPKYDEIKDSIRARGLDTVPKVTRNPELPGSPYIFSDGGNTRYEILRELFAETQDERFYRFHVLFKPWPGRLECLVGHLAENDVRGDLTFIDKALGIRKARSIHEETLGRSVTLRELSDLLRKQGYPIHNSLISRMDHTVEYLYPYMPELLASGLGYPQVVQLLSLRTACEKVWKQYSNESADMMASVFGDVCRQFDDPELYSLDLFRDELIGNMIQTLPHPSLNYDRWLIELDPKTQNQLALFGAPEPVPEHLILADHQAWQTGDIRNKEAVSREQTLIRGQGNDDGAELPGRDGAVLLSSILPSVRNEIHSGMSGGGRMYRRARSCWEMMKWIIRHFYLHMRAEIPRQLQQREALLMHSHRPPVRWLVVLLLPGLVLICSPTVIYSNFGKITILILRHPRCCQPFRLLLSHSRTRVWSRSAISGLYPLCRMISNIFRIWHTGWFLRPRRQ